MATRGGEPRHPVVAEAGRADERLLKQFSEAEWLALVPRQSPRSNVACPMDDGTAATHAWLWDPHQPDRITCRKTGEVFPGARFPTKHVRVEVLSGKTVDVPFVEVRHQDRADRIQIQARIDFEKTTFLSGILQRLGAAYAGTRDERYARIVALVLDAWANHVPDYFLSGRGGAGEPISPAEAEKQKWVVSRASDHNGLAHEWPHGALYAFDCIYDSRALQELSTRRGYDVRSHISRDFFGNIGDVFAQRVRPEWAIRTNLSGPYAVLADAATILHRPDYVEYLNDYLQATIDENFVRDGMYPESFGYHREYALTNWATARNVARYFNVHPADTAKLRETKQRCDQRVAFLRRCVEAHHPVCYPDGLIPPFGDSGPTVEDEARRRTARSAVLPAYGFVALGGGSGREQTQLDVAFNEPNNHCQDDALALTLFAFDTELLGNNRYSRSAGRPYNNGSLSHNLVVIDRESQRRPRYSPVSTAGSLVLYEPGLAGIAVAELDGSRAYIGKATRYQRLVILNTADPGHPYAIDLFAVTGGTTHDYLLHGATTQRQRVTPGFPTDPMQGRHPLLAPGETWREPKQANDVFPLYGMLVNMRSGRPPGQWHVTYHGEPAAAGVRLFMTDDGSTEVCCGYGPVLVDAADKDTPPHLFVKQLRPVTLARRRSADAAPLASVFVGLIEPMRGESAITAFERLPLADESAEAVAVRVRFTDGREDVVVVNLDNPRVAGCPRRPADVATRDGRFALRGRVGVRTRESTGAARTVTVGAERFEAEGRTCSQDDAVLAGRLLGIQRRLAGAAADAFLTDARLPEGKSLHGRWLSLDFGTLQIPPNGRGRFPLDVEQQRGISQLFQVDRVERADGRTIVHLMEDPAITMQGDTVTETMRPKRTFQGPFNLEIVQSKASPTGGSTRP